MGFPEAGRMEIINIGNIQSSYHPGVRPVGCPRGPSKRIQLYIRESNTLAGRIVTDWDLIILNYLEVTETDSRAVWINFCNWSLKGGCAELISASNCSVIIRGNADSVHVAPGGAENTRWNTLKRHLCLMQIIDPHVPKPARPLSPADREDKYPFGQNSYWLRFNYFELFGSYWNWLEGSQN